VRERRERENKRGEREGEERERGESEGERGREKERKLKETPWRVRDDRLWIIYNLLKAFRFFRNGFQLCFETGRVENGFGMRARDGCGSGHCRRQRISRNRSRFLDRTGFAQSRGTPIVRVTSGPDVKRRAESSLRHPGIKRL
jgi:hypothetical protein